MGIETVELPTLTGGNGFALNGVAAFDKTGVSVSSAGDINGDGFDDVIVGADSAHVNGPYSGAAYVVFGKATGFAGSLDLSALNGGNGFRLGGADERNWAGRSVSSAGDVNGDGFDDLIVGATSASYGGGASYVVFGKASGFTANLDLSALNGANGFRLRGTPPGDLTGASVSSAGDVNGDGFDDLIVGSPTADATAKDSGVAHVIFGAASGFGSSLSLSSLNGANGFRLLGAGTSDHMGESVSSAGDFNGDGFDDVIVGVPGYSKSHVVFGKAAGFGASIDLSDLRGTDGFELNGGNLFGGSVSSAGDFNGDGFDDLIVGGSSGAYLVFGKSSGLSAGISVSKLDGRNGFRLASEELLPVATAQVSGAGDVNGDGFDDVIVGAPTGPSYIVFGKSSGFDANTDMANPQKLTIVRLGGDRDGRAGSTVSGAGDVNGDGLDDVIVGAPYASPHGDRSGAAYVVFGAVPEVIPPTPYFIEAIRYPYLNWGRNYWNSKDGALVTITYSFMSSVPTDEGIGTSVNGGNPFTTFQPFNEEMKAAARKALGLWQQVSAITFVEISAADERAGHRGMIEFGRHAMYGVDAYARHPTLVDGSPESYPQRGNIFVRTGLTIPPNNLDYLFLHEIGHALGLKHSFSDPALPAPEDNTANTVMSYTGSRQADIPLGMFDIAAIQQAYGVNRSTRAGADTYSFADQRYLWDARGTDTITAAAMTRGVRLSLAPGSWNYAGTAPATSILAANQLFIGYGTVIENAIGSAFADTLIGNNLANTLDGGGEADVMEGAAGDDIYIVDNAGDVVIEVYLHDTDTVKSSAHFRLSAQVENLILTGTAAINGVGNELNNRLTGNSTANVLDGEKGRDRMEGGAGNDTYRVDDRGDVTIELLSGGIDLVESTVSVTLAANIEKLRLMGSSSINGTGNGLDNLLTGNAGNNVLDGKVGADTMKGGLGDDTYVVDGAGDVVIEGGRQGTDLVSSSVSFVLGNNVENLTLTGTAAVNATGNALANVLTGNTGINVLAGKGGNDVYVVDSTRDRLIEAAGEGVDLVTSSVTFALGANFEDLTLLGRASIGATGNALANVLIGNAGRNSMDGGDGADLLDGKGGADTMKGGLGDDVYVVDASGDRVIETVGAGIDLVRTTVSFVLGVNLENLELLGSDDLGATGNGLANRLTGNAGDNTLDGKAGADAMKGGLGDDVYLVDEIGDKPSEAANAGSDTVKSTVSFTLGVNIEHLTLLGSSAVDGTGNGLANRLEGNGVANKLAGGAGDDVLCGRGGNDVLIGGAGRDAFLFNGNLVTSNIDTVADFSRTDDTIQLDDAIFSALTTPGFLQAAAFAIGSAAQDASDRIIYDAANGTLLYDSDGTGAAAARTFAVLGVGMTLGADDFLVV